MMGTAGGMLKGAAVMGGIYGIQNEIKNAKAFEEVLVDVAVRGSKSREWMDELRGSMLAVSNEFGIGKDQLAAYVGTIIDQTGNTELAVKTLKDMTAVSYSANVPMQELAGTVVEMQSKLGLAPTQFIEAMGILASQADKGKVPLSQMSKFLPEVLNSTVQFGHSGVGALRDYGAMLQMAARGAGSLAEANTAMNRMLDQTAAKRGKIEKTLGIKLKKNGAWLQLGDMLKTIVAGLLKMKKEGKDVEKYIIGTWGIRGKKALLPMMQQGSIGWGNKVGADASGGGGLTSFDALRAAGGAGTIGERVARKRKLSPELDAWNKSVERLKNKLHVHLLPVIEKLGAILPQVGKALEWMIDNWKLLLVIWGSQKVIRFFSSFFGGGGGVLRAAGSMLGVGGFGSAGASGTAAATAGMGTAAASAAVGLAALAASLAPAVAGIKAMSDAYDPEKQKKLRKSLMDMQRPVLNALYEAQDKQLRQQGWTDINAERGLSERDTHALKNYNKYQTRPKDASAIMKAWGRMKAGKFAAADSMLIQSGVTSDQIKRLQGADDYQLGTMGMSRAAIDEIASMMSGASPAQYREDTERGEKIAKEMEGVRKAIEWQNERGMEITVNMFNPLYEANEVTRSRRPLK